jgi:hypothetical protein
VVVTDLETHIFTVPSTFHRTTIGNHDLEIVDGMDVAMIFLGNAMMNKTMGASTINQNDDLPILDVTDYLRVWGAENPVRELREMIGSTSRGFEGGVMSVISVTQTQGEFQHPLLKYPQRWP